AEASRSRCFSACRGLAAETRRLGPGRSHGGGRDRAAAAEAAAAGTTGRGREAEPTALPLRPGQPVPPCRAGAGPGPAGQQQERDDHSRRGHEERQHRDQSEQEHRRDRNGDRDRHRDHSKRRKNPNERPGGRGYERERDAQNLREQQVEREFYNERRREHRQKNESSSGDETLDLGKPDGENKDKDPTNKEKPSFELSGALLEDSNTFRGVVIKYSEPPEARIPKKRWRLYPFKNDEVLPVMYIHRQSAYLLGRHRRIADIPIDHPSCSKQHAVFQYRLVEYTRADGTVGRRVKPYIIDLGSGNGTFLNNQRIEPQRYYELKEKDVLKFGFSSREYVLLHESSDTSEVDRKPEEEEEEEEEEESDS
uniref:Smad nuclear interacting protein 1 n=1 Tax=Chrysemys picta bellii TaxID=8478 RepID=A0A8C3HZM0_CHRPI